MTQKEYKQISKALEKFTEHFIESVDKFTKEVKKVVEENNNKE